MTKHFGSVLPPPSAGTTARFSMPAFRLSYSADPPSTGTATPFGLPDKDADVEGGAALLPEGRNLDASTSLSRVFGGTSLSGYGSLSAAKLFSRAALSPSTAAVTLPSTALFPPAVTAPGAPAIALPAGGEAHPSV